MDSTTTGSMNARSWLSVFVRRNRKVITIWRMKPPTFGWCM